MIITMEDIDAALTSAGIGFEQLRGRAMRSPPSSYCNVQACQWYAEASNRAGVTADELAVAVGAGLDGDTSSLKAILAAPA